MIKSNLLISILLFFFSSLAYADECLVKGSNEYTGVPCDIFMRDAGLTYTTLLVQVGDEKLYVTDAINSIYISNIYQELNKLSDKYKSEVYFLNKQLSENMNLHPMWRCYKQHNGKSEICIKNTVTVDRVGFVREE